MSKFNELASEQAKDQKRQSANAREQDCSCCWFNVHPIHPIQANSNENEEADEELKLARERRTATETKKSYEATTQARLKQHNQVLYV